MQSDRFLDVQGARLRYRDQGSGPAVTLMHGWTLDLEMWEPQIEALATSFRVIRLDRRGFGLSGGRSTVAGDFADVLALWHQLGVQSSALVGMSQGARVAARLAALAPGAVSCVVLDGPPPSLFGRAGSAEGDAPIGEYRALVRSGGVAAFRAAWSKHALVQLRTADPNARELVARMIARYRGADLLEPEAGPETGTGDPSDAVLPERIRQPALVMTGALDLEARSNAADLFAQQLPVAQRAVIAQAGHLANLDNPKAYNAALLKFLERNATAG